jgi:hypothetical protein
MIFKVYMAKTEDKNKQSTINIHKSVCWLCFAGKLIENNRLNLLTCFRQSRNYSSFSVISFCKSHLNLFSN